MEMKKEIFFLFVLATFGTQSSISHCPLKCQCDAEPKACDIGVSLIMDGCNCCKICARQFGQECNDRDKVCDMHRNLFCDNTVSKSGDFGLCKAQSGRSCFHEDVSIASGQMFKPTCKKQCWCVDGAIGCVPTCPHETQVPRPDHCPNARLQRVAGHCCDQWTCEASNGDLFVLSLDEFWNEYVAESDNGIEPVNEAMSNFGNSIPTRPIYDDDAYTDDLTEQKSSFLTFVDYPIQNDDNAINTNHIPGDQDAQMQSYREQRKNNAHCRSQSSAWSSCSKTCGLGVSSRVTNDNPECRLVREQRLCEVRPCTDVERYKPKKGHQCLRHKRSRKRVTLKYAGCVSERKTKQRYCGNCHDDDRCCTPKVTRTSRVRFRCEDGRSFFKNVLIIRSCQCHRNCPATFESRGIRFALHGDMLRLRNS